MLVSCAFRGLDRQLNGVGIQVLIKGDGRNYPTLNHRVQYRRGDGGGLPIENWVRNLIIGLQRAIVTMSVGEKARITVDRALLCKNNGVNYALEGETSRTYTLTLLGIE